MLAAWWSGPRRYFVAMPRLAHAQAATPDTWQVEVAPFYLWIADLNGDMTVRNTTVPISLSFAAAAKHLAGVFTFDVTARRHRIGFLTDVMIMRLSTDATFTLPAGIAVPGALKLSNTLFEIGGSFLVVPTKELSLIGGVRTSRLARPSAARANLRIHPALERKVTRKPR